MMGKAAAIYDLRICADLSSSTWKLHVGALLMHIWENFVAVTSGWVVVWAEENLLVVPQAS